MKNSEPVWESFIDADFVGQLFLFLRKTWWVAGFLTVALSVSVFVFAAMSDVRYQSTALVQPWKNPFTHNNYIDFELETIINSPEVYAEVRRSQVIDGKGWPPRIRVQWLPGANMLSFTTISADAEQSKRVIEVALVALFKLLTPAEKKLTSIRQEQAKWVDILNDSVKLIDGIDEQSKSSMAAFLEYKMILHDRIRNLDVTKYVPDDSIIIQGPGRSIEPLPNRALLLAVLSTLAVPLVYMAIVLVIAFLKQSIFKSRRIGQW